MQYLGLASVEDPLYRFTSTKVLADESQSTNTDAQDDCRAPEAIKRCRKLVRDDNIEAYVEAEEAFSNLISSAASMTYVEGFVFSFLLRLFVIFTTI